MAARETMASLIRRLRRLIGDPASGESTWQDEDLQDALDNHRREARYAWLCEVETIAANGSVTYKIFKADLGDWEGSEASSVPELVDSSFNVLDPDDYEEDLLTGRWTFTEAPNYPVMISGWYYDLYGAAVEILEAWMASLKCAVDASARGVSARNSQKVDHLEALADRYRRQMWASTGCYSQTDFTPDSWAQVTGRQF
jgi:hypothetical protein